MRQDSVHGLTAISRNRSPCSTIYDEQLREGLEREHANEFVAIEPDSAQFFLGLTLSEAIQAARRVPDRLRLHCELATAVRTSRATW